jgi:hypothetical protein
MTQVLGIRNLTFKAFADDAAGTGFTLNNDPSKDYMAIITSPVVLDPPTAADFAGEWFKRKGEQGDQGVQGPQGEQGPTGPPYQIKETPIAGNPQLTFDDYQTRGPEQVGANLLLELDNGVNGIEMYWTFQLTSGAALSVSADFIPSPGSILPNALQQNTNYAMIMKYLEFNNPIGSKVLYTIMAV